MSKKADAGSLNDFFKQQSKTKKATKKAPKSKVDEPKAEEPALATDAAVNEEVKAEPAKVKAAAYESSDDEKADMILGDDVATIKDRKDVDAERRRKQEEEDGVGVGWRALDSKANQAEAVAKGQADQKALQGSMNFGGKPMFTSKKNKGAIVTGDFPDIGTVSQNAGKKGEVSKAASAQIGNFGSAAVEREPREPHMPTKKPVFTSSKKKAVGGGADLADIANTK